MKLAKTKRTQSRFKIPYKLFEDDEVIPDDFDFVANQVYPAIFQYVIFDNGMFDYEQKQREGIVATIENVAYIFITDGCFITEQIPFDTKVDLRDGHILLKGIFAVNKEKLDNYDSLQIEFEKHIKEDLLNNITKQIEDLSAVTKYLK